MHKNSWKKLFVDFLVAILANLITAGLISATKTSDCKEPSSCYHNNKDTCG